ncbi:MAG TPA: DNA-binding protein [Bacteroidia bacterium]|nr:DNA-binding protein [Bacteroidia bacterium]
MSTLQIIGSQKDLQKFVEVVIDKLNIQKPTQTTINSENDRLSQRECADLLGVSVTTLISYKRKKFLPFFKIGSRVFYSKKQVLNAIKKGNIQIQ